MAKMSDGFSPTSQGESRVKLKEMPSNTSTASPPVGLRLPPLRMKWRGPTRNSPLCGVHEAMQNAHNLLILAQAGKIKPSGC